MEYGPYGDWPDRGRASIGDKRRRMNKDLSDVVPVGRSMNVDSLMSQPGFTKFVRESSRLDSLPDQVQFRRSAMQTKVYYDVNSSPRGLSAGLMDGLDMSNPLLIDQGGLPQYSRPARLLPESRKRPFQESHDQSEFDMLMPQTFQGSTQKKMNLMDGVDPLGDMQSNMALRKPLSNRMLGSREDNIMGLPGADVIDYMHENTAYRMGSDIPLPVDDLSFGSEPMRPGILTPELVQPRVMSHDSVMSRRRRNIDPRPDDVDMILHSSSRIGSNRLERKPDDMGMRWARDDRVERIIDRRQDDMGMRLQRADRIGSIRSEDEMGGRLHRADVRVSEIDRRLDDIRMRMSSYDRREGTLNRGQNDLGIGLDRMDELDMRESDVYRRDDPGMRLSRIDRREDNVGRRLDEMERRLHSADRRGSDMGRLYSTEERDMLRRREERALRIHSADRVDSDMARRRDDRGLRLHGSDRRESEVARRREERVVREHSADRIESDMAWRRDDYRMRIHSADSRESEIARRQDDIGMGLQRGDGRMSGRVDMSRGIGNRLGIGERSGSNRRNGPNGPGAVPMRSRNILFGDAETPTRSAGSRQAWGSGAQPVRNNTNQGRQQGKNNGQRSQISGKLPGSNTSGILKHTPKVQAVKVSLEERLKRFIAFLKKEDHNKHPVNVLDCAFDRCKLGLKKVYTSECFLSVGGKNILEGKLCMNGLFLARAHGTNKKLVKKECYEEALKILLSKPAEQILKQKDPGTVELGKKLLAEHLEEEEERCKVTENEEIDEDAKLSSLRHRLRRLTHCLQSLKTGHEAWLTADVNFEKAVEESLCKLTYSYTDEELKYKEIPWFIGQLKIQDTVIAAASGISRESAKKSTCKAAINFLREKSPSAIITGFTVEKSKLMPKVEKVTNRPDLPGPETEKNLKRFIGILSNCKRVVTVPWFKERAADCNLTLLIVRHRSVSNNCDLFIDNIYIASGAGKRRLDAEAKVFEEALMVCSSSSAEVIYNDFKRLATEDTDDVTESIEELKNNKISTLFTNNLRRIKDQLVRLKDTEQKVQDVTELLAKKDIDSLVIVEHSLWSSDRYCRAFDILQLSAQMNLMALHYQVTEIAGKRRCQVFLQYKFRVEATARKVATARQQAFAKLLFQLYETQPTIKIGEARNGLSYETLKSRASDLRKASGVEEDELIEVSFYKTKKLKMQAEESQEQHQSEEDKQTEEMDTQEKKEGNSEEMITVKLSKWVMKVVQDMIEEHGKKETCEELVFGEGPHGYWEQIRSLGAEQRLHCYVKKIKEVRNLVVCRSYRVPEMLEILEKNNGKSGRYCLLGDSERPKRQELESYKAKAGGQVQQTK